MTKALGMWLFGYGMFLFLCGAAFFLLSPVPVPTPLAAGAITGGLAAAMGVMFLKGIKQPFWGAMMLTMIFTMGCLALAMQQWMLVRGGEPRIATAAVLTVAFIVSGVMMWMVKSNTPQVR